MSNYTITEDKSFEEINVEKLNNLEERVYILEQYVTCREGDIRIIDDIECLCVHINPLLFVDKNHDLCYYFYGEDYAGKNWDPYDTSEAEKWAYNYGIVNNFSTLTSYEIGEGLNNTNIFVNYNPETLKEGYDTIWNKITQFRKSHSDKWYLPSAYEFELLENYIQKDIVQNFGQSTSYAINYWTSSRSGVDTASIYYFHNNSIKNQGASLDDFNHSSKNTHTRLFCRPWD